MNELKPQRHGGHGVARRKLCEPLCPPCLRGELITINYIFYEKD